MLKQSFQIAYLVSMVKGQGPDIGNFTCEDENGEGLCPTGFSSSRGNRKQQSCARVTYMAANGDRAMYHDIDGEKSGFPLGIKIMCVNDDQCDEDQEYIVLGGPSDSDLDQQVQYGDVAYSKHVCNTTNKRGYSEAGYAKIKDSLRVNGQANCETVNGTACDLEQFVCANVSYQYDYEVDPENTYYGVSNEDICYPKQYCMSAEYAPVQCMDGQISRCYEHYSCNDDTNLPGWNVQKSLVDQIASTKVAKDATVEAARLANLEKDNAVADSLRKEGQANCEKPDGQVCAAYLNEVCATINYKSDADGADSLEDLTEDKCINDNECDADAVYATSKDGALSEKHVCNKDTNLLGYSAKTFAVNEATAETERVAALSKSDALEEAARLAALSKSDALEEAARLANIEKDNAVNVATAEAEKFAAKEQSEALEQQLSDAKDAEAKRVAATVLTVFSFNTGNEGYPCNDDELSSCNAENLCCGTYTNDASSIQSYCGNGEGEEAGEAFTLYAGGEYTHTCAAMNLVAAIVSTISLTYFIF